MKKLLLMALVGIGTYSVTYAGGWCAVGSANLSDNGNGTSTLTCSNDGVCYETDDEGNMSAGSIIYIHMGNTIIPAKLESSHANPPKTDPKNPCPSLPSTVVIEKL